MNAEITESEVQMHGCCHKNKLSICLCIALTFTTLALSVVTFFLIGYMKLGLTAEDECTSLACVRSAAEISEHIDTDVDPCEDFYEFVCGKFIRKSYEKRMISIVDAERSRIKRRMDSYIIAPPSEDDHRLVKMQKTYFRACLNESAIEADQDRTFLEKLDEIGDWPILRKGGWDERTFELGGVMTKAMTCGLPFEWFLQMDLHDEEGRFTIKLTRPINCGTSLDEKYFSTQRQILEQLITPDMATVVELRSLSNFERKLHAICENVTDSSLSLEKISNVTWNNEWMGYFPTLITGQKLQPNFEIAIEKEYFRELNRLLRETPKMVQANYVLWKIVEHFAPYLSKPIRDNYNAYHDEQFSRFNFCLRDTKAKFKFLSEVIDLRNYDLNSIQEEADEMWKMLTETLLESVENVQWRNNKTKESHLDFCENVEALIGGPQEMFEDNFFLKYSSFGKLMFITDNIIQMMVDWSKSVVMFKLRTIGKQKIPSLEYANIANSEFVLVFLEGEQELLLPASFFDSFLYRGDGPRYLNYAGLGSVISTEFVRALHLIKDNNYGAFANLEKNRKCFVENLQESNNKLNESLLFFLNYESFLGQDLAYRGYRRYVEANGEEARLVNLPFTPRQLFWIKTSLHWCHKSSPDEQSPLDLQETFKYRITGSVQNSPFFSEDFRCSSDASMNPRNKCPFW